MVAKANQLANFPLNFLRTGYYEYSDGKVGYRTVYGDWWSTTRSSAVNANFLVTTTEVVYPQRSNNRGQGFAVRFSCYVFGWWTMSYRLTRNSKICD